MDLTEFTKIRAYISRAKSGKYFFKYLNLQITKTTVACKYGVQLHTPYFNQFHLCLLHTSLYMRRTNINTTSFQLF